MLPWYGAAGGAGAAAYTIGQSARFNDDDSAYLSRTPRVAGNRRTWTWSGWVKRGNILGTNAALFTAMNTGGNTFAWIGFDTNDALWVTFQTSPTSEGSKITSRLFRDPSAWYHIVVAVDTTQATASNRVRVYVNGVEETSFSTDTAPVQNYETWINSTAYEHSLGAAGAASTNYNDCYIADPHLIDGQQLTASDFGEFSGVNWVPINPSVTYGTNGFHLDFADSSHFGKDVVEAAPYEPVAVNFDGTNDYLRKSSDLTSNADGKTGILSFWVKINGADGTEFNISSSGTWATATRHQAIRNTSNKISIFWDNSASTAIMSVTSGRTVTASDGWVHVLCAWDLANTTAQLYINDVSEDASPTATNDTIDYTQTDHAIGTDMSNTLKLNGELADYYFNNEVFLDMDTASNRRLFIDAKGNPVDLGSDGSTPTSAIPRIYLNQNALATWHTNAGDGGGFTENGALTAGNNQDLIGRSLADNGLATNDQVTDSPTDDAANDVGNYCVLNSIANFQASATLSNGNLTITADATGSGNGCTGTQMFSEGKWYFEANSAAGRTAFGIGIYNSDYDWSDGDDEALNLWAGHLTSTTLLATYEDNVSIGTWDMGGITFDHAADAMCIAFDADNNKAWIGVWDDSASAHIWLDNAGGETGDPVAGTNNPWTLDSPEYGVYCQGSDASDYVANFDFGQQGYRGTPPTGFKKMHTGNRAAPAITDPSQYFQVDAFTGTGAELARTLTDAAGDAFSTELNWTKDRDTAVEHVLTDIVRGPTKELNTNDDTVEETVAQGLKSFDASGHTYGTDASYNTSGSLNVSFNWKLGGSAAANTDGDHTSSVSANTTAGQSALTFTGDFTGGTVGHGLTQPPEFVIAKSLATADAWVVWHQGMTDGTYYCRLSTTVAQATSATRFTSAPSATVLNIGTHAEVNNGSTSMGMLCFHGVEGYSKFGSYTGNGSADGPFIYTGFRPAYVMVKCTTIGTANYRWYIHDGARNAYNEVTEVLAADDTGAESGFGAVQFDFTSNGFKIRTSAVGVNTSSATYIFAAFAEHPFGGDGVSQARAR